MAICGLPNCPSAATGTRALFRSSWVHLLFLAALFCAPSPLWAATVTLSVTGPQSGSTYYAGDSFTVTVTGAANSTVTVVQNGGISTVMGTTNGSGVLSLSGTWGSGDIGSYSQVWSVAGVSAPTLSFTVNALPNVTASLSVSGPQSGTTYYVGDSFTLTVTGAPNTPVYVVENGSLSGQMGTTNSSGVWTTTSTWTPPYANTYTQVWQVAGKSAPTLSFTVKPVTAALSVSGPQSGTTYYVGDTFTLTLNGPPNSAVYVLQNGSMSAQMGTTTSGGVLTITATWAAGDIGNYTQTWQIGGLTATPSLSFSVVAVPNYVISGTTGVGSATVTLSGGQASSTTANASGAYSFTVPAFKSYTVTPSKSGYTFSPASATFNNLSANQTANFTPSAGAYTISGSVGTASATVTLSGSASQTATANSSGGYSFSVGPGTYTVTPSKTGYTFTPASATVSISSSNQTANFTAAASGQPVIVSFCTVKNTDGHLELFGRASNNEIYHTWETSPGSDQWNGWVDLNGQTLATPAAAVDSSGNVEVFVRGTDNVLYRAVQSSPSNSANMTWASITSAGSIGSAPSVTSATGGLALAYLDTSGLTKILWQITSSSTGVAATIPGGAGLGDPVVTTNTDGRIEVFVHGTDNQAYRNLQTSSSTLSWGGWTGYGGTMQNNPSIGKNQNGRIELFVRDSGSAINHSSQTALGTAPALDTWTGWQAVSATAVATPTAAATSDGILHLFIQGTDSPSTVWEGHQAAVNSQTWTGWNGTGFTTASEPKAILNANNLLEVFAIAPGGSVSRALSPSWTTWTPLQTSAPATYTISGNAGSASVTLTMSGSQSGSATSNSSGAYSFSVAAGGTYTIVPSKTGFAFTPPSATISNVSGNVTQNFTANASALTISGTVGTSGATVTLSGSATQTTTSNASNQYSFSVASGGTFTVTPSKSGCTFAPASTTLSNMTSNQTANFTATCGGGGPVPVISGLSSTSAPRGASIVIAGSNFGSSGTVTFNGVGATAQSWTSTSITVPVPPTATSGSIVVTVGGQASNGVGFSVMTARERIRLGGRVIAIENN